MKCILQYIIAVLAVVLCYIVAIVLCSVAMVYVTRIVAWLIVPLYCGIGCIATFLCFKLCRNGKKVVIIFGIFVLLSCGLDIFRGLSYRDLAAFLFASAMMGSSESYS